MTCGVATSLFVDLDNPNVRFDDKVEAIETIVRLETHNGYKKDLFINALRWLFDHFDFETGEPRRGIRLLKGGGGNG